MRAPLDKDPQPKCNRRLRPDQFSLTTAVHPLAGDWLSLPDETAKAGAEVVGYAPLIPARVDQAQLQLNRVVGRVARSVLAPADYMGNGFAGRAFAANVARSHDA